VLSQLSLSQVKLLTTKLEPFAKREWKRIIFRAGWGFYLIHSDYPFADLAQMFG
jgi:hypothetical protein